MPIRIIRLSESSIVVEFGNEISPLLNAKAVSLSESLHRDPFVGFIEAVPCYSSVTIFFDFVKFYRTSPTGAGVFEGISAEIRTRLKKLRTEVETAAEYVQIPVDYEQGPDLQMVADFAGLSIPEVINLHTSSVYRVYMIGFLPGFAYLGTLDERISMPRKVRPALKVPKGSVGIAGRQTGIYPTDSPGGWQIIGKTAVEMFNADSPKITLLNSGDRVKFVDIRSI